MSNTSYLSSYSFRMGLECPTRLFYEYQPEYPTSQQDNALVNHIRFNKKQLVDLTKARFRKGHQITAGGRTAAAEQTQDVISGKTEFVVFDAVLTSQNLYHRFPIMVREGTDLHLYEVRTKAIKPHKHRFVNKDDTIQGKWRSSFLDLAFGRYVAERSFEDLSIYLHLVLPDKTARASINFQNFFSVQDGEVFIDDTEELRKVTNEISFLTEHQVDRYVNKIESDPRQRTELHPAWEGMDLRSCIRRMGDMMQQEQKHPPLLDMHCRSCPFRVEREQIGKHQKSGFDECWSERVEPSSLQNSTHIFNLIGHGTEGYLKAGYQTLDQIPLPAERSEASKVLEVGEKISYEDRQSLQILQAKGEEVPTEFAKPALLRELGRIDYPILFLDFETANMVVPFRAGSKPYESLVFQWSCHLLHEDQSLQHYDWIQHRAGVYPNYDFIRSLLSIPGIQSGSVVQYSMFEKQMIKDVRRIIKNDIKEGFAPGDAPKLLTELDQLLDGDAATPATRFVDMNRLVRDYYYHRKMNGSLGLKDVIAAVMKTSKTLRSKYSEAYSSDNFDSVYWWQESSLTGKGRDPYDIVEEKGEGISKGAEALMAFIELQKKDMPEAERNGLIDALLKYCELDTLSMVMLYQHWQEMQK